MLLTGTPGSEWPTSVHSFSCGGTFRWFADTAAMHIGMEVFAYFSGVGLLNHTGGVCVTALEIARWFSEGAEPFCFPPAIRGVPVTPHPCQHGRCQGVARWHFSGPSLRSPSPLVDRLLLLQWRAKFQLLQGSALRGPQCWSFSSVPAHPMPIPTRFVARLAACDLSVRSACDGELPAPPRGSDR